MTFKTVLLHWWISMVMEDRVDLDSALALGDLTWTARCRSLRR